MDGRSDIDGVGGSRRLAFCFAVCCLDSSSETSSFQRYLRSETRRFHLKCSTVSMMGKAMLFAEQQVGWGCETKCFDHREIQSHAPLFSSHFFLCITPWDWTMFGSFDGGLFQGIFGEWVLA